MKTFVFLFALALVVLTASTSRVKRDTIKFPTLVGPDKHAPWRKKEPIDTSHKTAPPPIYDFDARSTPPCPEGYKKERIDDFNGTNREVCRSADRKKLLRFIKGEWKLPY